MSQTLRKADGDLYIDPETGRPEVVSGPAKVDQELASLYLTKFDQDRNWGSELDLSSFDDLSMEHVNAILYLRLQQANDRLLSKQANDLTLDVVNEKIQGFSRVEVQVNLGLQAALFLVVADVGTEAIPVEKTMVQDFKPISLRHVVPPPPSLIPKGG